MSELAEKLRWEQQNFVWEVAEKFLAFEKYYIEIDGRIGEGAAFLIIKYPRGYGLFLNKVGLIRFFKSLRQARKRIKELVENANFPLAVWRDPVRDRKPFAENKVWRIKPKPGVYFKAFNIEEWEK